MYLYTLDNVCLGPSHIGWRLGFTGYLLSYNGKKSWFFVGKRHRIDGPAVEYSDGAKEWYLNGKLHREDGPAIEYSDGTKHWYSYGKKHRTDGPALEWRDGSKEWWVDGKLVTEQEHDLLCDMMKLKGLI